MALRTLLPKTWLAIRDKLPLAPVLQLARPQLLPLPPKSRLLRLLLLLTNVPPKLPRVGRDDRLDASLLIFLSIVQCLRCCSIDCQRYWRDVSLLPLFTFPSLHIPILKNQLTSRSAAATTVAATPAATTAKAAATTAAAANTNGATSIAGADFGTCNPTIKFEGGLGGRPATEFTFQSQDPAIIAVQQEALNPSMSLISISSPELTLSRHHHKPHLRLADQLLQRKRGREDRMP
jgi:hypothetical protein